MRVEKVEICANKKRTVLDMEEFYYVYIPASSEEKEELQLEKITFDPCWRIKIPKDIINQIKTKESRNNLEISLC